MDWGDVGSIEQGWVRGWYGHALAGGYRLVFSRSFLAVAAEQSIDAYFEQVDSAHDNIFENPYL
jgi:hypothetical protein